MIIKSRWWQRAPSCNLGLMRRLSTYGGIPLNQPYNIVQGSRRSKNAAFHSYRCAGAMVEWFRTRGSPILKKETVKSSVVCLSHGARHADVRGHSGDDQVSHPLDPEQQLEVGVGEGPASWFVNDGLTRNRIELGHDVVALLSSNEKPTQWTRRSYPEAG